MNTSKRLATKTILSIVGDKIINALIYTLGGTDGKILVHMKAGNALFIEAGRQPGETAARLYVQAGARYRNALDLDPSSHLTLFAWGAWLAEQARRSSGPEANGLWMQAADKFRRSLQIEPNNPRLLFVWGNALMQQAKRSQEQSQIELRQQAVKKYEQALAIEPSYHDALFNWAVIMGKIAEATNTADAVTTNAADTAAIWEQIADKYRQCLTLEPNDHLSLYYWGLALVRQAHYSAPENSAPLWQQAADKLRKTLQVQPTLYEVPFKLGHVLTTQAKAAQNEEAKELWRQAYDVFEKAAREIPTEELQKLTSNPKFAVYFSVWGCALHHRAGYVVGDLRDDLWKQAIDKYKSCLAHEPHNQVALYNWGVTLLDMSRHADKNSAATPALWKQSADKFRQTLELAPNSYNALVNLGYVLNAQAEAAVQAAHDAEADELWSQACAAFAKAVEIQPDSEAVWSAWGNILNLQARRATAERKTHLLSDTLQKWERAEAIRPGTCTYNLSCIAALQGQITKARQWLEQSAANGTLPSRPRIEADSDLQSLRALPWFQEILQKAKP